MNFNGREPVFPPVSKTNVLGATVVKASFFPETLKGETCCDKKVIRFEKTPAQAFCPVCHRMYGEDGQQRENWRFRKTELGLFETTIVE